MRSGVGRAGRAASLWPPGCRLAPLLARRSLDVSLHGLAGQRQFLFDCIDERQQLARLGIGRQFADVGGCGHEPFLRSHGATLGDWAAYGPVALRRGPAGDLRAAAVRWQSRNANQSATRFAHIKISAIMEAPSQAQRPMKWQLQAKCGLPGNTRFPPKRSGDSVIAQLRLPEDARCHDEASGPAGRAIRIASVEFPVWPNLHKNGTPGLRNETPAAREPSVFAPRLTSCADRATRAQLLQPSPGAAVKSFDPR